MIIRIVLILAGYQDREEYANFKALLQKPATGATHTMSEQDVQNSQAADFLAAGAAQDNHVMFRQVPSSHRMQEFGSVGAETEDAPGSKRPKHKGGGKGKKPGKGDKDGE